MINRIILRTTKFKKGKIGLKEKWVVKLQTQFRKQLKNPTKTQMKNKFSNKLLLLFQWVKVIALENLIQVCSKEPHPLTQFQKMIKKLRKV